MINLETNYLFASLVWGTIGSGYVLYSRKQREITPFLGGVIMILISCLVTSWFWMSLASLATMAAVFFLMKNGH